MEQESQESRKYREKLEEEYRLLGRKGLLSFTSQDFRDHMALADERIRVVQQLRNDSWGDANYIVG